MKKILLAIFVFSFLVFGLVANFAYAQVNNEEVKTQLDALAGDRGAKYGTTTDPRMIVVEIIKIVLSVLGFLSTAFLVYAGFMWATSQGNEEKITKAKGIVKSTVIGLALIFASYGITLTVSRYLNIATGVTPFQGGGFFEAEWGTDEDMSDYYNTDPMGGSTMIPEYKDVMPSGSYSTK